MRREVLIRRLRLNRTLLFPLLLPKLLKHNLDIFLESVQAETVSVAEIHQNQWKEVSLLLWRIFCQSYILSFNLHPDHLFEQVFRNIPFFVLLQHLPFERRSSDVNLRSPAHYEVSNCLKNFEIEQKPS